jgi:hypothetical protein
MYPDPDRTYADLRARARQRVDSGQLPGRVVETLAAGYGSSRKACCLCGQKITPIEVEYELCGCGTEAITLHIGCYTAWRDECLQRTQDGAKAEQSGLAAAPREDLGPDTRATAGTDDYTRTDDPSVNSDKA